MGVVLNTSVLLSLDDAVGGRSDDGLLHVSDVGAGFVRGVEKVLCERFRA
jgi:hypothetical protein